MRSVVITGASRGLGLATAAHLYGQGWTVLAAMRSPETGMKNLRDAIGLNGDDPRLIPITLDVANEESVRAAASAILDAVGAPDGVVHNAGVTAVGTVEEMPLTEWENIVATNFMGPVRLTAELLPAMRAAGRGRIVMVSSASAILGMPGVGAYGASKGALERWAESLSQEVTAFGIGVTVLVAGTFKTDILELTHNYGNETTPYAAMHANLEPRGRRLTGLVGSSPDKFAPAVARALDETRPFTRHIVGLDALLLSLGRRVLPTSVLQRILRGVLGIPQPGSLRHRS